MTQATSILSFIYLKDKGLIGQRQLEVLETISKHPNSTDREITDLLGRKDPNYVRPRRKELYDLGIIECSGVRECIITDKQAETWKVRDYTIDEVLKNKEITKLRESDKKSIRELRLILESRNRQIEELQDECFRLERKLRICKGIKDTKECEQLEKTLDKFGFIWRH